MQISLALRKARLLRGMSMRELSRRSGVGMGAVSHLERGLHSPNLTTLEKLSSALEIPLMLLLMLGAEERDIGERPLARLLALTATQQPKEAMVAVTPSVPPKRGVTS